MQSNTFRHGLEYIEFKTLYDINFKTKSFLSQHIKTLAVLFLHIHSEFIALKKKKNVVKVRIETIFLAIYFFPAHKTPALSRLLNLKMHFVYKYNVLMFKPQSMPLKTISRYQFNVKNAVIPSQNANRINEKRNHRHKYNIFR